MTRSIINGSNHSNLKFDIKTASFNQTFSKVYMCVMLTQTFFNHRTLSSKMVQNHSENWVQKLFKKNNFFCKNILQFFFFQESKPKLTIYGTTIPSKKYMEGPQTYFNPFKTPAPFATLYLWPNPATKLTCMYE